MENSLKRLQLDYVDLYYLHFPDGITDFKDSIGELVKLKEEGKIRSIGISNVNLEQLKEANANGDISVVQSPYSMLDRSAEEGLLQYAIENHISFILYGPLAFGLLGGGFDKDTKLDENDWRNSIPLFEAGNFEKNIDKVEKLKAFAAEKGTNIAHLALAWLLAQDGVDTVIPGGRSKERVIENIKASDVELSVQDLSDIDEILG